VGKSLDTLVADINAVIDGKGGWDSAVNEFFSSSVGKTTAKRLGSEEDPNAWKPGLRMSNLGTPCRRKLWYSINNPEGGEVLAPSTKFKFLFGDILEDLMISLAMAAGHEVTGMQDTMEIEGIKGHRDCVIDGVTVDVKSASSFGFKKFKEHGLRGDDPFGYIQQLSSYVYASKDDPLVTDKKHGAFLVVDKQHGHICLDKYNFTEELKGKQEFVKSLKEEVGQKVAPKQGFEAVNEGKSGNKKLGTNCSYCDYKKVCWPTVRTFIYARGPVFLTTVKNLPKVPEVT